MTPLLRRGSVPGYHFRAACPRSYQEQESCFFFLESEPRVARNDGLVVFVSTHPSVHSSMFQEGQT